MSDANTSDGNAVRRAIADVLLVIDTVTLLDRHPDAVDAPVSVDADCCYGLAADSAALTGVNAAQWRIDVRTGDRLRLRSGGSAIVTVSSSFNMPRAPGPKDRPP